LQQQQQQQQQQMKTDVLSFLVPASVATYRSSSNRSKAIKSYSVLFSGLAEAAATATAAAITKNIKRSVKLVGYVTKTTTTFLLPKINHSTMFISIPEPSRSGEQPRGGISENNSIFILCLWICFCCVCVCVCCTWQLYNVIIYSSIHIPPPPTCFAVAPSHTWSSKLMLYVIIIIIDKEEQEEEDSPPWFIELAEEELAKLFVNEKPLRRRHFGSARAFFNEYLNKLNHEGGSIRGAFSAKSYFRAQIEFCLLIQRFKRNQKESKARWNASRVLCTHARMPIRYRSSMLLSLWVDEW